MRAPPQIGAPAPARSAWKVVGLRPHPIAWGTAVIRIQSNIPIEVMGFAVYTVPKTGTGKTKLVRASSLLGPVEQLIAPSTTEGDALSYALPPEEFVASFHLGPEPDAPWFTIFEVEPEEAEVGFTFWTQTHADGPLNLSVHTAELMPTHDVDPWRIDWSQFRGA